MKNIEVVSHLDYFTASFAQIKSPRELNLLEVEFKAVESIRPMPHYDLAWRLQCGGSINVAHSELQGARIDLSGQALQFCRDAGMRDTDVILCCCEPIEFKQVTRMDYCWDIQDAGSVRHCANHWLAGRAESTIRGNPSGHINYGNRSGRTIYFGSKASTQRVRVYDKGAELKLLEENLIRVEIQVRKPHSQAMYIDTIMSSLPIAARSRLKAILDFPRLQWWQQAISGETKEIETIPRKQSNWQRWISGQVSESIKQHWEQDAYGDRQFIIEWLIGLDLLGYNSAHSKAQSARKD